MLTLADKEEIKKKVIEALKEVYDPEIPISIYDLGLIYEIEVTDDLVVNIKMGLTTPFCPVAGSLAGIAEEEVRARVDGIKDVVVELTYEPPWHPSRVTPEGREQLKMIYGYDIVEEMLKREKEVSGN